MNVHATQKWLMLLIAVVAVTAYGYLNLDAPLNPFHKPTVAETTLRNLKESLKRIKENKKRFGTQECQDAIRKLEEDAAKGEFASVDLNDHCR